MTDPNQLFENLKDILATCFSPFLLRYNFLGFLVRPLDFILFFGLLNLLVDLFRMVVMRGNDD